MGGRGQPDLEFRLETSEDEDDYWIPIYESDWIVEYPEVGIVLCLEYNTMSECFRVGHQWLGHRDVEE